MSMGYSIALLPIIVDFPQQKKNCKEMFLLIGYFFFLFERCQWDILCCPFANNNGLLQVFGIVWGLCVCFSLFSTDPTKKNISLFSLYL